MPQTFDPNTPDLEQYWNDFIQKARENFNTLRSMFYADTAPSGPVNGQPWWDGSILWIWNDVKWIEFDTREGLSDYFLPLAGGTMEGDIDLSNNRIYGLSYPPTLSNEATSKEFVEYLFNTFAWQKYVKDKDLTAPPGAPSEGDRYIVGAGATGAWSGQDENIAEYKSGAWVFYTVSKGWFCWVDDESAVYIYLTEWTDLFVNLRQLTYMSEYKCYIVNY